MHGGVDGAGGGDVVVLDHDHVVEAYAVVHAAADQHRPLVQQPQPRHRLARLQNARCVALSFVCATCMQVNQPHHSLEYFKSPASYPVMDVYVFFVNENRRKSWW